MAKTSEIWLNKAEDFYNWVNSREYSKNHTTRLKAYFRKHWANKKFSEPMSMYNYIQTKELGKTNIIKAIRVYLNFCEIFNKLPTEQIESYKKVLKVKHERTDFYVPEDEEVIKNYQLIKENKVLELIYLVLATSGIRYIECIDFLSSFELDKFSIKENYVSYSISKKRNTKNINNIYLPMFVYEKLFRISNQYDYLRQKYKDEGCSFSLKYLRKWQYNFLLFNQVPESVADFIQGRVNKSVASNHYLAKSQQAGYWYGKVVEKLERIVS